MGVDTQSASESIEKDSDSFEEEEEEGEEDLQSSVKGNGGSEELTEYEKQRMKRIEENRAKMEAMGLRNAASSFVDSVIAKKRMMKSNLKGKRKLSEGDDDEYVPEEEKELGLDSSSEGDDSDSDGSYGSRIKKSKGKTSTPSRKVRGHKHSTNSEFVDDDDAIMQAIALSLQDSAGFLDDVKHVPSRESDANENNSNRSSAKQIVGIQEETGKRKTKNSFTSRVRMTEDELIVHFFQFDEAGKGGITLRDLRKVATAHDFTWTDKEMANMIHLFDSDGDGQLSLDDFTKIVERCNMRKV